MCFKIDTTLPSVRQPFVWKVVYLYTTDTWRSMHPQIPSHKGESRTVSVYRRGGVYELYENAATQRDGQACAGFYVYLRLDDARFWAWFPRAIVKCRVRPQDFLFRGHDPSGRPIATFRRIRFLHEVR